MCGSGSGIDAVMLNYNDNFQAGRNLKRESKKDVQLEKVPQRFGKTMDKMMGARVLSYFPTGFRQVSVTDCSFLYLDTV